MSFLWLQVSIDLFSNDLNTDVIFEIFGSLNESLAVRPFCKCVHLHFFKLSKKLIMLKILEPCLGYITFTVCHNLISLVAFYSAIHQTTGLSAAAQNGPQRPFFHSWLQGFFPFHQNSTGGNSGMAGRREASGFVNSVVNTLSSSSQTVWRWQNIQNVSGCRIILRIMKMTDNCECMNSGSIYQ